MSVMTDIRDLSVSLSMRELVVRSNSSNGQPPSSGVVGDSSRRPTPQVIFSTMLTFPEGICGLFVSSWWWGGCALDECPISWGDSGQSSQALGGKGEECWAEQIRVWKFGVNREFRSLAGHWSLSVKKSHLSAR